jgi:uncharacterized membrane protein
VIGFISEYGVSLTAVLGIVSLSWAAFGFFPHLSARRGSAAWWMTRFYMIKGSIGVFRMAYWDIIRPVWRVLHGDSWNALDRWGLVFNAAFNTGAAYAGFIGLMVLFVAIPDDRRSEWSPLTAPLYPRKPWRRDT